MVVRIRNKDQHLDKRVDVLPVEMDGEKGWRTQYENKYCRFFPAKYWELDAEWMTIEVDRNDWSEIKATLGGSFRYRAKDNE